MNGIHLPRFAFLLLIILTNHKEFYMILIKGFCCLFYFSLLIFSIGTLRAQETLNRVVTIDGLDRQFIVYLPKNFTPVESLPLLFCFHGGGDSAEGMMRGTADFRPLADNQRFIAVYPQGVIIRNDKDPEGSSNWNSRGPYDNGTDDIGFTAAIIDLLVKEYTADPNRIYACGFSLGGNFVWDLACYLGDRFSAVASVAASMWQWTLQDCSSNHRVGILSIHGTNDFYNPYDGNQYSISIDRLNEHWALINGSEEAPVTSQSAPGVTQYVWNRGEGCHTVAHYRVQNGEHVWPSFATQAIWDFVSHYKSSGLIGCSSPVELTINAYSKQNQELTITVENLPEGRFEIRSSKDGQPFHSLTADISINQNTVFPLTIPNIREDALLLQVWEKP